MDRDQNIKRQNFRATIPRAFVDKTVEDRRVLIIAAGIQEEVPSGQTSLPTVLTKLIRMIRQELNDQSEGDTEVPVSQLQQAFDLAVECLVDVHDRPLTNQVAIGQLTEAICLMARCRAFEDVELPEVLFSLYLNLLCGDTEKTVLSKIVDFFSQCCGFQPLFSRIHMDQVLTHLLRRIQTWNSQLMSEMLLVILTFVAHYTAMTRRLQKGQGEAISRLCFTVVEQYQDYLEEETDTLKTAIGVLFNLIDTPECELHKKPSLREMVEILKDERVSGHSKWETMIILEGIARRSEQSAVKMVYEYNIIQTGFNSKGCAFDGFLFLTSTLSTIPSLTSKLFDLAEELRIQYGQTQDDETRDRLLAFFRPYIKGIISQKQPLPSKNTTVEGLVVINPESVQQP